MAKPGVDPTKHAAIYMRGTSPFTGPNEPDTIKEPLEVEPATQEHTLHPMSRVNSGKIYTVEYNVKVVCVGKIAADSIPRFNAYLQEELINSQKR